MIKMDKITKQEIQKKFLTKASHYKTLPALIKNSPCDKNAKVCLKDKLVELKESTKTGNIYVITIKGYVLIEKYGLNKKKLLWEI
jgi:hypothetical protein